MASEIPLTVQIGTLDPSASGETRQQFAEKIAERLIVTLPSTDSTFLIGGGTPTSDEGPWFKEVTDPKSGNSSYELWVWSPTAAAYIPLTLNQTQLRYFVGVAEPSSSVYDVWVRTNAAGKPLGISTYNTTTSAWESHSYTPDEIDAFFAGEASGKKQVDWDNVTGKPDEVSTIPRSISGALAPEDANYNWEQVYHRDAGCVVIYDPIAGQWKTLDGTIGDVKEVTAIVLGSTGDFAAGVFTSALGRNPGWQLDSASQGRVVVGANDVEAWDATTPLTKDPTSIYGSDEVYLAEEQLPDFTVDIKRSDAINGGGSVSNGYMTGDVATGTDETLNSSNTENNAVSKVQKSIAYFRLRKSV